MKRIVAIATVALAPKELCAPTTKSARGRPQGLDPDQVIDHFTCYSATSPTRPPAGRVTIADQFGSRVVRLLRLTTLCTPTRKGETSSEHPVQHLACYAVTRTDFRPRTVRIRDQFGLATVRVSLPGRLCVPSTKRG